MVRKLIALLTFSLCVSFSWGQKVKYKDLFILLNAKQYDQAEPFLKIYLKDTDDNPNAHLFMGMIYHEKALKNDILKETEKMVSNLDSAVYFYDKAYKGIDEKEIKKNDEYYQAYNRRDLRTGKFGVKLSDVQFDLEKKIESLKERIKLVGQLKQHFVAAETQYGRANARYTAIQSKYGTLKKLYLKSDESTISGLAALAAIYDSSMNSFNEYKAISRQIGKTGYDQVVDLKEIESLERDGAALADFKENDLKLWNYRAWANQTTDGIKNEIFPMRDQLIAYDIEINKLREKLRKDSVSVKGDIGSMRNQKLYDQLKKYDPNPMPLDLFEMKMAELEYLSALIVNKPLQDSVDIQLHIDLAQKELKALSKLDSIAGKLVQRDLDKESDDYNHFVTNAYGTPTVLKSLVKATQDFAEREKHRKNVELTQYKESLRWIVTPTDSIPLFMEVSDSSKFRPLVVVEESYTAGLIYNDSLATGYFQTILPSRKPGVGATFNVDQKNFVKRKLSTLQAITSADQNGQVFYVLIYSQERVNDKIPATLAKIYRTDGLSWTNNFMWDQVPNELSFAIETGEVSIKTANPAGEVKMIYVDKNGKLMEARQ